MANKDYIDDCLREIIHHRDGGVCQKCKKQGEWIRFGNRYFACEKGYPRKYNPHFNTKKIWVRFHIDHIFPECLGGTTEEKNLRLLCPKCNLSRGKYEVV